MAHKLLLADDSVTIQRVIELTFADEDVEVTTVGDGQLAIERLDIDPPDIILADVDMPKRDGYEVAAYVKSRPKLAHIPVVLLTGAFEPIDQARATAAGSSDVLAKPFEPQMVINRVKELLGKKRDEDGSDAHAAAFSAGAQAPTSSSQPQTQATDSSQPVSLDDYFDQLDAAFSNMQPAAPAADGTDEVDWPASATLDTGIATARQATGATLDTGVASTSAQSAAADKPAREVPGAALDTLIVEPSSAPAFMPEPVAAPKAVASAFAPGGASTDKPSAPIAPSAAPIAPSAAPIASAAPKTNPFANLSAAKAEAAARPVAPVITDELIEQIVSRVLERMTDRAVRETVSEIVSQTAERLVQEEIERIRAGS